MPLASSHTLHSPLSIDSDAMDDFIRAAAASWEIWKNHISTEMPPLDFKLLRLRRVAEFERLNHLFHLFCTSNSRVVMPTCEKPACQKITYFRCPPLTLVYSGEAISSPQMHTPQEVIQERIGTSDEIAVAFVEFASSIGVGSGYAIAELHHGNLTRYAIFVTLGKKNYFLDLIDGLFFEVGEDTEKLLGNGALRRQGLGLLRGIFSAIPFAQGTLGPSSSLSRFYGHAPNPIAWNVAQFYSSIPAIEFFWHLQMARHMARQVLNADLLWAASSNPKGLGVLVQNNQELFAQVRRNLAFAESEFAEMPPKDASRLSKIRSQLLSVVEILRKNLK